MMTSVLDQQGEHIADSVHRACQATTAFTNAVEDNVEAARQAVKEGSDAAEEFLNNATKRVQRHPIKSIALTFAVGIVAGMLVACRMMRQTSASCKHAVSEK